MTKRNPYAIKIAFVPENPNGMIQMELIMIKLSKQLLEATNIHPSDIISYELNEDLLSLEYHPDRTKMKRGENASYVRRVGGQGGISITKTKLPELYKYNIPVSTTELEYQVIDGKIVIDMTRFKKPVIVGGFGSIAEPVAVTPIVKRGGFEILSGLKA